MGARQEGGDRHADRGHGAGKALRMRPLVLGTEGLSKSSELEGAGES